MDEVQTINYEQKTNEELQFDNMRYENEELKKQLSVAKDDLDTADNVMKKAFRKIDCLKKKINQLNQIIISMEENSQLQA